MGGRGCSIISKHISNKDDLPSDVIFLDDPESEYHNEMFKKLKSNDISTRKSTDIIDDVVLKRQQEQIYNVSSKYNKLLKHSTQAHEIQFGAEDLKGTTLGYCSSSFENGQIAQRVVLDTKQLANYDKVTKTVTEAVNKGWFAPINTMFKSRDYLVTHEFGHAVENALIAKLHKDNNIQVTNFVDLVRRMQANIKNEVVKIWKESFTTGEKDDKICLSRYSEATDGEWFAETFANLELSDEPAPIAKALKEYLRRHSL